MSNPFPSTIVTVATGGLSMNSIAKIIGVVALGFLSSPCWAYYDVLDTGEVMQKGKYKLTADTQLLTSTGGGNVGVIADAGIQEEYGLRAIAGLGRTDYFFGGLFKWMPIPDIQNQPAVGFNAGLLYAKWYDNRDLTFRFEPLVSKKFSLEQVIITPYGSIPLGLRTRSSNVNSDTGTDIAWQFVVGSQLQIEKWKNLQFMGEVGLELDHSLSHISVAAIWYFDEENGFELK